MSGLITVEDYNSALLNYDDIVEVVVDGSKFPEGETHFMYDFLEIELDSEENTVKITNKIHSYLKIVAMSPQADSGPASNEWLGWNNVADFSDFNVRLVLDNNLIPSVFIITNDGSVESINCKGFIGVTNTLIFKSAINTLSMKYGKGNTWSGTKYSDEKQTFTEYNLFYFNILLNLDTARCVFYKNHITSEYDYHSIDLFKNPNFVNITGNLYSAKKDNTLTIEPFMAGTEENPITCKVRYLDKEQTFTLEGSQTIKVDLREYTKTTPLTLTVELSEGPYTNKETLTYEVPVGIQTVNSWSALYQELTNNEGTQIIRLGANLTAPYNDKIPIMHDTIIYGNNKSLNLNHSSFIIQEGKTLKIYDTSIKDADTCFIQKDNSILEAHNCSFINNTSRNNEGLGSCVYCDIDLDSLTVTNDFTTIIDNCTFKDCHGAILHGGELTVTNTTYTLTDSSRMNTHSPYFLYQTDGEVTLTGNTFDVDIIENVYTCETLLSSGSVTRYDTNAELINTIKTCRKYLSESDDEAVINDITDIPGVIEDIHYCEAQENANLAQCLFVLGETATINDKSANELQNPNNINLTHNNSHIFMKYYYPEIGACVYISPMSGYETKNLCYNISGTDWIYKYNTQITRADAGAENTDNPLRRNQ